MLRAKTNLRSTRAKADAAVKPRPPRDLWDALARARQQFTEAAPPGSFSVTDYAEKFGLSRKRATYQIEKLVSDGVLKFVARVGCAYYYSQVSS